MTTTVYEIHELEDAAKEEARDWYIQEALPNTNIWYDHVLTDFENIAEIFGITIWKRTEAHRSQGSPRTVRCIWFSGFSCQGDGACFEGSWEHALGAPRRIREYAPQDKTLHDLADRLTETQKRDFYELSAVIKHHGRDSHEHSMTATVERENKNGQEPTGDASETVTHAMRELARWLYRSIIQEPPRKSRGQP